MTDLEEVITKQALYGPLLPPAFFFKSKSGSCPGRNISQGEWLWVEAYWGVDIKELSQILGKNTEPETPAR